VNVNPGGILVVSLLVTWGLMMAYAFGLFERKLKRYRKGEMSRQLVYFCVAALTIAGVWAMVLKTVSATTGNPIDLSDVLVFVGGAFGGELLLLLVKRVFSKPNETEEDV
jgi:cell division protein FtsW (lipid II flippase)